MVKIKLRRKRSLNSGICSCRVISFLFATTLFVVFIFQAQNSTQIESGLGSPSVGIEQILRKSKQKISKIKPNAALRRVDSDETISNHVISKLIPNDESSKTELVLKREGTGPTSLGYVKDFQHERDRPLMAATSELGIDAIEKEIAAMTQTSVKPCKSHNVGKRYFDAHCSEPNVPLFAYNFAWFPRTICGQEIKPHRAVAVPFGCQEYSTGLSAIPMPPVSGAGMQPIVIKSRRAESLDLESLELVDCDIPCRQERGMQGSERFVDGEQWTITFTDSNDARSERLGFREDHFFSSQSFKSSVPYTFFDWSRYGQLNRKPIDWFTAKVKAVYLVDRKCSSPGSRRHKYFDAISAVISVDSYGSCSHNIDVPQGMSIGISEDRIEIMKQYRAVLAFDAGTEKDFISPMIWDALVSGSVPVVVGAENMRSHLPDGSFVWSGDFSNWDELANHVKEILENKNLWESYQVWRGDESAMLRFNARYEFSKTSITCRLCRWSYAKKYGLGWDDERQEVSEPILGRRLCTSGPSNIISTPFEEAWVSKNDHIWNMNGSNGNYVGHCNSTKVDSIVESNFLRVDRTVSMQDGVVDVTLKEILQKAMSGPVLLRLMFASIENVGGAHFKHTHTLVPTSGLSQLSSASMQDEKVKVTVLSDWVTNIKSPSQGVMEIVVMEDTEQWMKGDMNMKRIRIIMEDFDSKNEKTTEFFPSAFCKKIIKDFSDPLEIFYSSS